MWRKSNDNGVPSAASPAELVAARRSPRRGKEASRRRWPKVVLAAVAVLGSTVAGMPASQASLRGGGTWTPLQPPTKPSARAYFSMAYDSARSELVLFGGQEGGNVFLNDTWTFDGKTWEKRNPPTRPPRRGAAAMAYDAARQKVVLFGGDPGFQGEYLNDTWSWDGTTWKRETPSVSPLGRIYSSMAYDATLQTIVLFGGEIKLDRNQVNDTWTLHWVKDPQTGADQAVWKLEAPPVSPTPRDSHRMVYDPARRETVMFGGFQLPDPVTDPENPAQRGHALDETWTWNGATWSPRPPVPPASVPRARYDHALSYDPVTQRVVLFGGNFLLWGEQSVVRKLRLEECPWTCTTDPSGDMVLKDTWTWDGTQWTQQHPPIKRLWGRATHEMAYLPKVGKSVMFGGVACCDGGGRLYMSDETWGYALTKAKAVADFDGDTDSDTAFFRPSTGQWFVRDNAAFPVTYGTQPGDVTVPGDYDGDGKGDVAVFRAGTWFIRNQPTVTYGTQAGDLPIPADYDGDGRTDIAVFRPGTGQWFVRNNPAFPLTYGTASGDVPVPADYDGDERADVAVFRAGTWFVRENSAFPVTYGTGPGDVPLQLPYAIRKAFFPSL